MAAAAMFLVVAGLGTYAITQGRTGDVAATVADDGGEPIPELAPATTTTSTVVETTTTIATTTTSMVTTTAAPIEPQVESISLAALPPSADEVSAAQDFAHLLSIPGSGSYAEIDDGIVGIDPEGQDARVEVSVRRDGNGITATGATSASMRIDSVTVDGDELVVRGQGEGFEAAVFVDLVGSDGTRLALQNGPVTAGSYGEIKPFEARIAIPEGVGEAFVVAQADNAGSGVIPAFAAIPVRFEGRASAITYTVFRVFPADSDNGLNIRDRPGTDEGEVLATLPPGETGIRRLPTMPALVGDSFWWNIETADGTVGWAHSSFLTPDASTITDAELAGWADTAVANLNAAEYGGLDAMSLSRRVQVALGWIGEPTKVGGPDLFDLSLWTEAGEWAVPEPVFGEGTKVISLRSLLDPPDPSASPQLVAGAEVQNEADQSMVDTYFAGTRAITVLKPVEEGEPASSIILFYEAGPTGPELVGVMASLEEPDAESD